MSLYQKHRLRAQFKNTEPTLTDQSQAATTDLNIIVKQFRATGQIPPMSQNGISGDFTQFPHDFRDMIEHSRQIAHLRGKLPEKIRELSLEEILALKPEDITRILAPEKPADPPAGNKEDAK